MLPTVPGFHSVNKLVSAKAVAIVFYCKSGTSSLFLGSVVVPLHCFIYQTQATFTLPIETFTGLIDVV